MSDPTPLIEEMQGISHLATGVLRTYLTATDLTRAQYNQARVAQGVINTAVSLYRAHANQQRYKIGVARLLTDGDLDQLQEYIRREHPDFPAVRHVALPTA